MRRLILSIFVGELLLCLGSVRAAEEGPSGLQKDKPLNRILLIYDASNSMNARWQSDTKMAISKRLIMEILDSLSGISNLQLALRVYGHESEYPPLDCQDSRLEVPFSSDNVKKIIHRIKTLIPKGATPIAYSLEQAANDFPACENCRNIIILITDGIEECSGDPCAASAFLQSKGIALKPFIIGIGDNFETNFRCVGEYFDASKETDFVRAFEIVISQALNTTTAQVNLLDEKGKPTVTNVNMTFYDHVAGKPVYHYVHTLNYRGFPDTLTLDPLHIYDLVVHTMPACRLDSVVVFPGIHNMFALDAAQGDLTLKMTGSRSAVAKSIACIVKKRGDLDIVNVQYINDKTRYLTGFYDMEVLTLPRINIQNVEVSPNTTTTIEIPMPGIFVLQRNGEGYGSLYAIREDGKEELIYTFEENVKIETLYLQPGRYRMVNRSKYNLRTSATRDRVFTIEPGVTVNVVL